MPDAFMASTTSPGPGVGSGKSSSASSQSPRNTTPFMAEIRSRRSEIRKRRTGPSDHGSPTSIPCLLTSVPGLEHEARPDRYVGRNRRQIREQLRMLLHYLEDVFRLDMPVHVEGGCQEAEPVEAVLRAPQRPIIVGGEPPVVLLNVELHGGFGHFRLQPGNPPRGDLSRLLGISTHPFVGFRYRGEEFFHRLCVAVHPRAQAGVEAEMGDDVSAADDRERAR